MTVDEVIRALNNLNKPDATVSVNSWLYITSDCGDTAYLPCWSKAHEVVSMIDGSVSIRGKYDETKYPR